MRKLFAIWCIRGSLAGILLITPDLFAEDAVFTGTLIRKYYQHLIPQAVELGVFGWFLELDSSSKVHLQKKIATLNEEVQQHCAELEFDASMVQLFLSGTDDRQLCRHFEGTQVEVLGRWPSSPHVFRPIPSYQLHLTEIKPIPKDVVSLSGVLHFKVFPGPPNYACVEDGDYPEGCWILKLDDQSKDMLAGPMSLEGDEKTDEIAIELDQQFEGTLEQYANAQVTCLGHIHHAETAHHHTPLLLRKTTLFHSF